VGPWLFDDRLIILKKWSANTGLDRDLLSTVPVWVRFPSLQLKHWSNSIISKIASVLGITLFMDKATANCERLEYSQAFVEISATKPLFKFVELQLEDGNSLQVEMEYE